MVLLAQLADAIGTRRPDQRLRVAVDGAPAARPAELADALVDPLRSLGRPVVRASAGFFLRAASLRLEHGRTDPDALLDEFLDAPALERELLGPWAPAGSGRYVASLRDPDTDRPTRAAYAQAPPDAVLLLDGSLLLGLGLSLDYVVHLHLGERALARRTPAAEAWTLPAYARYAVEADPREVADGVVMADDARHPALALRTGSRPPAQGRETP